MRRAERIDPILPDPLLFRGVMRSFEAKGSRTRRDGGRADVVLPERVDWRPRLSGTAANSRTHRSMDDERGVPGARRFVRQIKPFRAGVREWSVGRAAKLRVRSIRQFGADSTESGIMRSRPMPPKCLFGLPHHRRVSPGNEGKRHPLEWSRSSECVSVSIRAGFPA